LTPGFHLALPVRNLSEARALPDSLLGCLEGHSNAEWVDFDIFGRAAHLSPNQSAHKALNRVDGEIIPLRHFGAVLATDESQALAKKSKRANVDFVIAPTVRGKNNGQAIFFINHPSGNTPEFKSFHDETRIFAR